MNIFKKFRAARGGSAPGSGARGLQHLSDEPAELVQSDSVIGVAMLWPGEREEARSKVGRGEGTDTDIGSAPKPEPIEPIAGFHDSRRLRVVQELQEVGQDDLPSFRGQRSGYSGSAVPRGRRADEIARDRLRQAFTPTRPKTSGSSFVGRRAVLSRVICAIEEERAHLVIFGGRGVGKTSLANVMAERAREAGIRIVRYPCGSDTTFEDLFRGFLRRLPVELMDRPARGEGSAVRNFEELVPAGPIGPTELATSLQHLREHVIYIIDEFDRVESEELKRKLAETVKNVSDVTDRVTFVVLGIGQTLEGLLGKHPSIQRHIRGIHLPLMEPAELQALMRHGELQAGISFEDNARDLTVTLSKGMPYDIHLIGLYAGRLALERGSRVVQVGDLRVALEAILREMDPIMVSLYDRATRGERNAFVRDVLFAAAFARSDSYGAFSVSEAARVLRTRVESDLSVLSLHRGLTQMSTDRFGPILQKCEPPSGVTKYIFVNPAMRQYVLLRQAHERGII